MEPTRFMRIPFFVTGYPVTEENMDAIAKWCGGYVIRDADKPFIHVPVERAASKKQYEAYVGSWVVVSVQRGEKSFKVYTEDWLRKQFMEISGDTFDERGLEEEDFETRTGTTREITPAATRGRPVPGQPRTHPRNTASPRTTFSG